MPKNQAVDRLSVHLNDLNKAIDRLDSGCERQRKSLSKKLKDAEAQLLNEQLERLELSEDLTALIAELEQVLGEE